MVDSNHMCNILCCAERKIRGSIQFQDCQATFSFRQNKGDLLEYRATVFSYTNDMQNQTDLRSWNHTAQPTHLKFRGVLITHTPSPADVLVGGSEG